MPRRVTCSITPGESLVIAFFVTYTSKEQRLQLSCVAAQCCIFVSSLSLASNLKEHMYFYHLNKVFQMLSVWLLISQKGRVEMSHRKNHETLASSWVPKNFSENIFGVEFQDDMKWNTDVFRAYVIIHSGYKSNKCNQCDFASSQAGNLRIRLKMHSGENPIKCVCCNQASSRADILRAHLT